MKFNGTYKDAMFKYDFDARDVESSQVVTNGNFEMTYKAYVKMKNGDEFVFDSKKYGDRVMWNAVSRCLHNWERKKNNPVWGESLFR